jgi:L-iditol 2-dehydrogenase
MDWIARDGVVAVPEAVSFEVASLMEPLNTCLRCVQQTGIEGDETVAILGQGPVGLMLTQLCARRGAGVVAADLMAPRLARARRYGAVEAVDPAQGDLEETVRGLTEGRGADAAIVATPSPKAVRAAIDLTRPGGRVMLFAQTEREEQMQIPVGQVCVLEKRLLGSYSSSIDLNDEVAQLLFGARIPAAELVTHRFPLEGIREAVARAREPDESTLKIVVTP